MHSVLYHLVHYDGVKKPSMMWKTTKIRMLRKRLQIAIESSQIITDLSTLAARGLPKNLSEVIREFTKQQ